MFREDGRVSSGLRVFALVASAAVGYPQGVITTVAGTEWTFPAMPVPAVNAPLGPTGGVAIDASGNIYIADVGNHMVMRVTSNGTLTVVAGNGISGFSGDGGAAVNAELSVPQGLAVDSAGNLYIADQNNNRIRRVSGGIITTVAGNGRFGFSGDGGPAVNAELGAPSGLAVDSAGNLYLSDLQSNRVRKVSGGVITTVAGNGTLGFSGDGGPATAAAIAQPSGLALDSQDNLFIAEPDDGHVRRVSGGIITTVAGSGTIGFSGDGAAATSAALSSPSSVAVDSAGNLFIADGFVVSPRIRKVSGGIITTIAGNGTPGFSGDGGPATSAQLGWAAGVAVDSGGSLYIADNSNDRIRRVSNRIISTVAGNGDYRFAGDGGASSVASLQDPQGVAVDALGNLYIADTRNDRIRKVSGGIITTVAGNGIPGFPGDGGLATSAELSLPGATYKVVPGIAVDAAGNLYIPDNNRIRKVSGGIITTVAGNGIPGFSGDEGPATSARLNGPVGVAVDADGNLFIADAANNRVRKVSGGIITTVAGNGVYDLSGDGAAATSVALSTPRGVAVDSAGNLYIAEDLNRVRKVSAGIITTVAGTGATGFAGDGGPATSAELSGPTGLAVDASGNLYISEGDARIRKVSGGTITTLAGNGTQGFSGDGGPPTSASIAVSSQFSGGVATDSLGNFYIADAMNNRIREVLVTTATFAVSPASLAFSASAVGAAPAPQPMSLSSGAVALSFTVSSNVPWLNVTPAAGSTPAVLNVAVDQAQLSANHYSASITITASNGFTQIVPVTLDVSPAPSGKLGVSAPTVAFSFTQGSSSASAQLSILNLGGGSIAFTSAASVSAGGNWLQASPASGTASPGTPASLTITATPGSLPPGTYSGSVAISSPTTGESISIPATMSISGMPQTILLSQTGLTFTAVAQGGTPLPQSFGILNTGLGSMSWSAKASTLSGGPWLSIDQGSGTVVTPFTDVSLVNVSVNPAGLGAGTYYGQIAVLSAGAANSPQSVSVVLNLLPEGSNPGAEVQPAGLIFIGSPGSNPGSQNVMVSNPQANPITFGGGFFTVPTGGAWAQFLPANATVRPDAPVSIAVQPDYTNLTNGVYQGFVSLGFADGSSRSVHVLAVVVPDPSSAAKTNGGLHDAASSSCTTLQVQPTALTDPSSTVIVGQPATLRVKAADNCGNLLTSGSVTATFSNGDTAVNLVSVGAGNWSGTWTPRNISAANVSVQYNAFLIQGTQISSGSASLTVWLQRSSLTPFTAGAANAASGAAVYISPGGLVSIYGSQLAAGSVTSGSLPFPKQVNGTQVLMGGIALPLRYVASGQINAQVPFNLGINTQQQLIVENGNTLSVPQSVVVAAAQPAVYTQDQTGTGPGVIVDGTTLVTASNPAHIGDVVVIYCNGLGAVSPAVETGTPAPSEGPLSYTMSPLTVLIGGVAATVNFAGLAPGYPDLYQVNAVVPVGVQPGNSVPLVLGIAGQTSPPVTMAIQ